MITFKAHINEKMGVIFYNPETIKFLNKLKKTGLEYTQLKNLIDNNQLTIGSTPKGASYIEEGVNFIRVQDIDDDGNIDLENCKKISLQYHLKKIKSKIDFMNILVVITGATVGKTSIFEYKDIEANINQNIIKIVVDESKIDPHFLYYYIKSKAGQIQLIRNAQRMAQEYLNYPSIKSISIVYPIDKIRQRKILEDIKDFRKKVYENKLKYEETIKRLASIFESKINFNENLTPKKEFKESKLNNRLDCFSLNPNYYLILKILKKLEKNKIVYIANNLNTSLAEKKINKKEFDIIKFNKFRYLDIGNTTEHQNIQKGYEEDLLINLPTRARIFIKENDILIPKPIGSNDKITIVPKELDGQLCSTGFIVLRTGDYDKACLITAILKSEIVQKQFFYLQSGSVQPEISIKNFKKILIPIPNNNKINNAIIKEFKEISKESQGLLKDYLLNKSKIEDFFIKQIIK